MTEVDKAVERIRVTGAYRLLVIGYRCLPLGAVVMGVAIGVVALWALKPPLVFVPFVIALGTVFIGVASVWAGLLALYTRRLMPRGGTNRHKALMRALRQDVTAPVRRRR
ncbi:hypothetical protein [Micromonospora avicenniae]|uniref:Uncharacterized protein n=1 Tax=Micromonospora avicenniae TaxID=1198245 RepID=A0A1N6QBQ0_9ACTN|nr:hypothetical protein [Micromonospora avicenniae]SIQ13846.1 hypothetical protein SAMN05444858_101261 [Micromonospora avicenniae]